jgi:hypothetical protein
LFGEFDWLGEPVLSYSLDGRSSSHGKSGSLHIRSNTQKFPPFPCLIQILTRDRRLTILCHLKNKKCNASADNGSFETEKF